ncbi:MAG: UDP-2,3-diacylglucosamine diphosphatase [Bacteroidales bacterium]
MTKSDNYIKDTQRYGTKFIYFLSDFHLGVGSFEEEKIKEEKIVCFLQSIETSAKRIFLLGDIFDFWFEYYSTIPKGFVLFQAQIKHMVQQGIVVDYFCGNHDLWQKDYFTKELGVIIHRQRYETFVFDEKTFVIGHGDGLDAKDIGYKIMDAVFSNRLSWWLFSLFPACVGLGIARHWSRNNRRKHKKYDMKDLKEKEPMYKFCQKYLETKHADYFLFGHRHIKKEFLLKSGTKYINTGCWIGDSPYAVWDSKELLLKKFE